MFLESLSDPNRINIKDLVVERPQLPPRELPFDPRRDLTKNDFNFLKKEFDRLDKKEDYKERSEWCMFLELGATLRVVFPELANQINFETEEIVDGLASAVFIEGEGVDNVINFGKMTVLGQIIRPGMIPLMLDSDDEVKLTDEVYAAYDLEDWGKYVALAPAYQSIYPNHPIELVADQKAWGGIVGYLEQAKSQDQVFDYVNIAVALKLLYPNRLVELDQILDQGWDRLISFLQGMRDDSGVITSLFDFANLAMKMTLLVADRVVLTKDEGIQITLPPQMEANFKEPIIDLPIRRNF